ncbi:MAG: nucleotide-binding protein [Clostridia bacterium]|nr:nucleotide-binding protein [Clostridia bacterium]
MKDRIFIGWSGSNDVALKVKHILEERNNYICCIGGNADNNSQYASVGDTVLRQIKNCNQAIIIFQNRADGAVSNNLFFELGYVFSSYGPKKVHCVRREAEKVILPSDFDNSFVEAVKDDGDDTVFAEGIVEYFKSRQKMSVNDNKMYLINNRYLIHDKIVSHYSDSGSKCSDYELAQYLLFYMQAAHMFEDQDKVYKEIFKFKQEHNLEFSSELSLAVGICLTFFELGKAIKIDKNSLDAYVEMEDFWKFRNAATHNKSRIQHDDVGVFNEWADMFVNNHMSFGYMLVANNTSIDKEMRAALYKKTIDLSFKTLESIAILERVAPCQENNDSDGILSLLRSYAYRNLFVSKDFLGDDDSLEWLKKSLYEREHLKNTFIDGTLDTKLYNNFCMEYYLALVNYYNRNASELDEFDLFMLKKDINDYLDSIINNNSRNAFITQIEAWCKNH